MSDAAASRPALTRFMMIQVILSTVRAGEIVEEAILAEAVARSTAGVLLEVT